MSVRVSGQIFLCQGNPGFSSWILPCSKIKFTSTVSGFNVVGNQYIFPQKHTVWIKYDSEDGLLPIFKSVAALKLSSSTPQKEGSCFTSMLSPPPPTQLEATSPLWSSFRLLIHLFLSIHLSTHTSSHLQFYYSLDLSYKSWLILWPAL